MNGVINDKYDNNNISGSYFGILDKSRGVKIICSPTFALFLENIAVFNIETPMFFQGTMRVHENSVYQCLISHDHSSLGC